MDRRCLHNRDDLSLDTRGRTRRGLDVAVLLIKAERTLGRTTSSADPARLHLLPCPCPPIRPKGSPHRLLPVGAARHYSICVTKRGVSLYDDLLVRVLITGRDNMIIIHNPGSNLDIVRATIGTPQSCYCFGTAAPSRSDPSRRTMAQTRICAAIQLHLASE